MDSDEEPMYTQEEDKANYDDLGPYVHDEKKRKVAKVLAAGVDSEDACKMSHGESAAGFQDLNKKALYQKEQRADPPTTKEVDYT